MSEDIRKFSKRIYTLLFLCVLVYVSSKPFIQCFSVNGHSMENTLRFQAGILGYSIAGMKAFEGKFSYKNQLFS